MSRCGYMHFDDGKKWLRIVEINDLTGDEWDECISEWEYVIDTVRGVSYYRHKLGQHANVFDSTPEKIYAMH